MRRPDHVRIRHIATVALTSALAVGSLPGATTATEEGVTTLPRCAGLEASGPASGRLTSPWQTELDKEGTVIGHRLTLRRDGREHRVRTGRRGFMVHADADRLLIGERTESGTRLDMIDVARGCRLWTRQLGRLLYPERDAAADTVRFTVHDRDSRRYEGTQVLDPETGETQALLDTPCVENCLPNDGAISITALEPAGAAQPTPSFNAGGWSKDKTLRFRWKPSALPPAWAKGPLEAGALDARRTSASRSPGFVYSSAGANSVAYTGTLPSFCGGSAIACASRSMPTFWGVWIRPHGTDFAWGTLRWCQKTSSASGCFDIRRVMLHELGHVAGLNHPSSAGFTLAAADSIMQGITPVRPSAGASRHAFGRCDVATLQELYDTPDNKTDISTCNDVATAVTLSVNKATVARGASVKLTATLRISDRTAYRQLAANPLNGRSLQLKYRRAGSSNAWATVWMRSLYQQGRYEATLVPGATWEFKAVFPRPGDEGLRYSRSGIRKVRVRS